MITYTCPRDLEQFGFRCLTGEACGLGIRLLYDVSEDGKRILARTLGLDETALTLPPAWNGGDFDAGSVMLTNDMAETVALFGLLFQKKCIEVWRRYEDGELQHDLYGLQDSHEIALAQENRIGFPDGTSFYRYKGSRYPGSGDRNTHMISGRTV